VKLDTEFIQLPLSYEVERLQEEVLAIPERAWRPHPQGHPGNSALPLLAVGGDPANDSTSGAMAPTPHLERCEYLRQVLASLETVLGRTRLMRLDGNAEATLHVDTNYYWAERVRIHVPIVTSPAIEFICEERSLHMPEGEAWIFDAWRRHNVLNPTGDRRIHLVADTVGSSQFWDLVARGRRPFAGGGEDGGFETRLVPYRPGAEVRLETEGWNFSPVMSPWELERLAADVVFDGLGETADHAADEAALRRSLVAFTRQWRAVWARYGPTPAGLDVFKALRDSADRAIARFEGKIPLANGVDAVGAVRQLLLRPALNPELMGNGLSSRPATPRPQASAAGRGRRPRPSRFDRPIFIVAPPRSGTSLLFETLSLSPSVRTIDGESHREFESIPHLHPANRGWDSNRLGPADARPRVVERLEANLMEKLQDRAGNPVPTEATGLRLLEKTPKNALRVPFLDAAFPDALFIYIYREPQEALSSMIAAWESGRFRTYPDLPGWDGPTWSLVLTPEWRNLKGKELPEIVAEQWRMSSEILLRDLERLPPERWSVVGYHNFLADTQAEVERLCRFAEIDWDVDLSDPLPLSRHTLTPPRPDKWKQHAVELDSVLPRTAAAAERGRDLLARPVSLRPRAKDAGPEGDSPYRSVSAGELPNILGRLESTLLVSTYQTGKLVAVRELEGHINTHFRNLESPMGVSHRGGRLAIGTRSQVCEYQNVPQLCERLKPAGRYDACFVPRSNHYTGDIRVHDVAFAGDELWFVNTRFSCLATLDGQHSFVPRWQPPFVSALTAEDRCHLNGLAVVDDEVRYVTALGESDEPGGWRDDKAHGGVLIDVESGETVVSSLSMPHSPRWHNGRLWLLESGQGTLAVADLDKGKVETVCELPGFTRGLAFAGALAFVGLSEVREATTFGGLPLTGRLEERQCGVWVVNIGTGQVVGFLRFEDLVQEIFDVELLPACFPEIAEHGSDAVNEAFVVPEAVA
jgi:uncharacterized protein (TIGR03032 family)